MPKTRVIDATPNLSSAAVFQVQVLEAGVWKLNQEWYVPFRDGPGSVGRARAEALKHAQNLSDSARVLGEFGND